MTLPLKSILIADDDKGIRDLLQRSLADRGYEIVDCVSNGAEAIERVRQFKPNLLIMDVHMPHMDGMDASRQIIPLGTTAIVLLTADQDSAVAHQALDLGVCGYMNKPFELSQLVPIMESGWHRFLIVKALQDEMRSLQDNLETRKLLEKAKGILMEQQGFREEEAHRTIQKLAQDQGITIKELCRSLIQVRMVLGGKSKAKKAA